MQEFASEETSEHLTLHPAGEYSLTVLADLFTRAYTDYFFPVHMDLPTLSWLICTQTIDLAASRVVEHEQEPVGFLFISSRGLSQRVAAMGVLPEHRSRGLGRRLLEDVSGHARRAGHRRLLLEVIEENAGAVMLYRDMGFEVTRALVGYERPAGTEPARSNGIGELTEVDPKLVARAIVHEGERNLPWQRTAAGFFSTQPPSRAWSLEEQALAVVSQVREDSLRLEAIVVPRAARRRGWGSRMVTALAKRYPGRSMRVTETVPEDLAPEFFAANGFRRTNMRQFEMVLNLSPGA